MGRDVAGLRFDKKPNMVDVKSNGTNHVVVDVSPKVVPQKVEMKDYEPDEHKQDALDEESTNHEPEEKIIGTETDDSSVSSPQFNDQHSPMTTKRSQPNSTSMSTKPQHFSNKEPYDEEDNCSLASSTATSTRTNKFKVTVPVAPRFTCEERLERRKEYYTKLEEKHKALEKERLECEARTKEEEAAAIKQLRKSMVYKANPIPSFYREGPPPKAELKKPPVTRAKSPKLTRRKSCGDAVNKSSEDTRPQERATRHSAGVDKEGKNSLITPKGKDRVGAQKSIENSKMKDHLKEDKDADDDVES